ncbi:MAG: CPBP family intramembrane metalloprotease [Acidobacteria bacterium]|nr:CPBP family intramembrane metalloprotease [Acidobacteriota bacterium]
MNRESWIESSITSHESRINGIMAWQHIFINPQRYILRSGWRVAIFFIILFPLATVLGSIVGLILTGGDPNKAQAYFGHPLAMNILNLLSTTSALIASVVCLRAFDHLPLRSIGYQLHRGWWRDYLIGTGMAAIMITVIVGIEWLAGAVSLSQSNVPARDLLYGLGISFVFFNLAAAFEEIAFRGYPLQTLLRDMRPAWAVIITSSLFGIAHSLNPHASILGLFNTILAGIWLAVAYLKTRNLWLCTSLHWSWNWTMSAIYGLNVSGLEGIVKTSLFASQQTGPEWLTGGQYGPEGGLLVTVVISLSALLLWRARWLAPSEDFPLGHGSWVVDGGSSGESRITNHESRARRPESEN